MSVTSEQLLNVLEEYACLLKKTQVNLKKCPKQRLTKGYISGRIKCIEEYWQSFKSTHQELIKCTPKERRMEFQYFANEEYYSIEELYICLQGDLNDMLTKSKQTELCTDIQDSQVKLPRIQLPTFSGNYDDWPTFHDLFTSLVDKNTTLSKVQKIHYLKTSIAGEPASLLKHVNVTENNYEQAWNILKHRYGNKKIIVNSLLKRLFSQRKVSTHNVGQIKTLLDTTTECLNNLQNLQITTDNWDPMIIYVVVQKLDFESHKSWEEHVYNHDSEVLPTWEDLKKFLESTFRTLELVLPSTSVSREVKTATQKTYHVSTILPAKNCPMCNEGHTLCHCKAFTKLQPEERNDFVRSKSLCYNCLIPGHSSFKCRLRVSCRLCKRRHHTMLHQTKSISQSDNVQANHNHVEDNQVLQYEDPKPDVAISSHLVTKKSTALLATALIPVKDQSGQITILRALIDQGSQANFISERAAQLLSVKRSTVKGRVTGVASTHTTVNHVVQLELLSRHDIQYKLLVQAYVIATQLTAHLPTQTVTNSAHIWPYLQGLPLADPSFYQPGRIDMLLGVEVYAQILKSELIKGPPGSPTAQNTSFGWILFGKIENNIPSEDPTVMHHSVNIEDMLQTLWEIDEDDKKKLTYDEQRCETIYNKTYKRNEDGTYIVKLPFKTENPDSLKGNTREIALKRLLQLEKRFERNSNLKEEYRKVMNEYLSLNHMEEVPKGEVEEPAVYLPHHAVMKETSETTKVRVVFNASSIGSNNIALNDELLVGPQLQEDMRSLVMRWRLKRIGYVADIEKMYRQILVAKEDTDYQRILWRGNDTASIRDYRLLRVTFGLASAPYLAVKTLQKIAEDEGHQHPEAAKAIKEDFFMDDLMSGQDTTLQALSTAEQISDILSKGGFKLQKLSSNSIQLMKNFKGQEGGSVTKNIRIDMKNDNTIRTLGLFWDIEHDVLQYKLNLPSYAAVITKRSILSEIQKLFDPLGWLAPALVPAKLLIQTLWLKGISWDEEINSEIHEKWLEIRQSFKHTNEIQLRRWLHTTTDNINDVSIHGFCDASIKAYGAVAYLRVRTKDGEYKTGIIAAKTRVAPVKPVSLPRLELCGAVLLSQLLKLISKSTRIPNSKIFAWTDSTIVLSWLQGDPARWQTFVRNRVVTILDNIGNKWFHVPSPENPADLASRGVYLPELKNCDNWWHGPEWLRREDIEFRRPHGISTNLEIKEKLVSLKITSDIEIKKSLITQFENFNTLPELLRSIAYCVRFLNYRIHKNTQRESHITTEELHEALEKCIRLVQNEEYLNEMNNLKSKKNIDNRSKIKGLKAYLDERNILRVGGRIRHANLDKNTKHPIILGPKGYLVKLIVADAHKRTLHGGIQLMINYIRSRFWIIRVKNLVRAHVHRCIICARQTANNRTQIMGDLPAVRVTPARPFLHSGVDFAGPLTILRSRGRGAKCEKAYICIFICMATKAIHLELVGDLSSNAFIGAFKRFVSRRGKCSHIWSDRGTNFVGANKELCDLWREANLEIPGDLTDLIVDEGTQWHFNPPYSPNFGGLWEAGVKSVKYHLKRILSVNLTFEEMSTTLCQIEACLNSRPLCPLDTADTENFDVITPGHFLIGEAPITIPEPNLLAVNVNSLSRWQHTQRLVQDFWKRWQTEYLVRLQQRPKWLTQKEEFQIGDIVLIKEEHLPPSKWALGRIVQKHPGKDSICRVYSLRCCGKIIKRPVTKLCELPTDSSN